MVSIQDQPNFTDSAVSPWVTYPTTNISSGPLPIAYKCKHLGQSIHVYRPNMAFLPNKKSRSMSGFQLEGVVPQGFEPWTQ